jgi:hypothetical protein
VSAWTNAGSTERPISRMPFDAYRHKETYAIAVTTLLPV